MYCTKTNVKNQKQVIKKDMETLKSWRQETIQESFNEDRLKERAKDATNALNDILGYLKELGIGDAEDIKALQNAKNVTQQLQ